MYCSNEELKSYLASDGNKLIYSVWETHGGGGLSFSDYKQEAYLIIARSLAKFDTSKNAKKSTYIYKGLCNVIKVMRRHRAAISRLPERCSIPIEDIDGFEPVDPSVNVEDDVIDQIERQRRSELLWRAIRSAGLDADEMTAIQLSLQDLTQQEVATKMGVRQPKVSKLLATAMCKIRCALRASGWKEPGYELESLPDSAFQLPDR